MKNLAALIDELETSLPLAAQKNEAVSAASIGWHIEHSLLALIKMISAVEHSKPEEYKWKFNLKRIVVLAMNKFPRGKAKAPESVRPAAEMDMSNILALLDKAKQKAASFEKLPRNKYFTHPVFGDIRHAQARKVITIHTDHHLRIIRDIISK